MSSIRQYLVGGVIFLLFASVMVLLPVQDLQAMPAFARKYKTSCVTCHTTFPQLNAVGDAFRLDGYRFKDDERYVKEEPLELGDEVYKRLWPKALWPGHIPQNSGFSASARFFAEVNTGNTSPGRVSDLTFVMPHELELSWAGNLGEKNAGYGDMIFMQEDYGTQNTYSWLWVKAWGELSDLFGPEDLVNLRVGTLGMHTMGLYTATNEKRIGIQPYRINSWMIPWPETYTSEGLVDFWGNTFVLQPQPGIEVSGFTKRFLYYVGVVNGNMEKPLGGRPELFNFEEESVAFFGQGRNTSTKDFYAGLAYKIGGLGFDGSGEKDDNMLARNDEFWRDDSLVLSLFGYRGTAKILVDQYDDPSVTDPDPDVDPHTVTESDDDFWRLAIGAKWKYKDLTVSGGYMWARDDNPFGVLYDNSVDVDVWYTEAFYFVYPWLIPYTRFESIRYQNIPEVKGVTHKLDSDVLTLGVKAHIRANVHLTVEYNNYLYAPGYICMTDKVTFVQLMCSF